MASGRNEYKLNLCQQLFVEEYINCLNATQAYMKIFGCKYDTARTNAAKLLAKPNVCAYKEKLLAERREAMTVERDFVISNAMDVFMKCSAKKPVMEWNPEEKCLEPTGEWQFDSKGALGALDLIANICGMKVVKQEVSATVAETKLDKLAKDLFDE